MFHIHIPAPITTGVYTCEPMLKAMLSRIVAWSAEVEIVARATLPSDPRNVLLTTGVTDDVGMEFACKEVTQPMTTVLIVLVLHPEFDEHSD